MCNIADKYCISLLVVQILHFNICLVFLQVLGYSQFHKIAHHVVVGNQVIVRGRRRRIIKSVIDCLKVINVVVQVFQSYFRLEVTSHACNHLLSRCILIHIAV